MDRIVETELTPRNHPASANGVVVASTVVSLGIWCAFDYWSARPDPEWYGYGVTGLSWYVLCGLLLTLTVAQLVRPHLSFARTLSVVVAPLPIVTLALVAITLWLSAPASTWALVAIAFALLGYLGARLRVLHAPRIAATVFSAFIVSSLLVLATQHIYVSTELWYPAEGEEQDDDANAYHDTERILFDQPARIDAAIDRVAPSTGDRSLLYFVGFGGDGSQQVFASEVRFAAGVVAARYATDDRSLMLVNDDDDRASSPLATVSGLRHALRGIAKKMNLDRDALFLFLTSHGDATPLLSVSNGNLPLEQLTGAALADALDESGITWRVIVISACHAGAFIEPLRNDRTIVLAAAAAPNTSFGCSDDRDLTYFGEALFRDALPTAPSLLAAFETARNAIADREKREGITPSEPQAYVGAEMSARWGEFETGD